MEEDPDDEDEVALVSESFTPPPPPPLETPPKQASTTTAAGGGATDKKKRRPPPAPLKRQQQGAADGAAVPAVPAHEAVTLELVKEVRARSNLNVNVRDCLLPCTVGRSVDPIDAPTHTQCHATHPKYNRSSSAAARAGRRAWPTRSTAYGSPKSRSRSRCVRAHMRG